MFNNMNYTSDEHGHQRQPGQDRMQIIEYLATIKEQYE